MSNHDSSSPGILSRMFAIDLRTLALFRVSMAGILLIDLIQRWSNISILYTDQGILPRDGLVAAFGESVKWTTIHYHTGANSFTQSIMFGIAALCAVGLLLGYRTWWFTFASCILLNSLNRRLPTSSSGGDWILRLLLFWSLFLPLGARWSIDAALSRGKRAAANWFCSLPTAAILLQFCYIYWFTAILKLHPDWLSGEALGHALRLDSYARPFGMWLEKQHGLTVLLTYATLVVEVLVPVLVLSPVLRPATRWIGIIFMAGLHVGIAVCMNIGLFPYISMLCLLLFIPTESWDWLAQRLGKVNEELSDRVTQQLRSFLPLRPVRVRPTKLCTVLAMIFLLFITSYNVMGLDQMQTRGITIPPAMRSVAKVFCVDQRWAMFAPTPDVQDGWFAMPANLADGSYVDIWLGWEPASNKKPPVPSETYPTFRVTTYMAHRRFYPKTAAWSYFARYYVNRWNTTHPKTKSVNQMNVVFVGEKAHNQDKFALIMFEYDVNK